MLLLLALAMVPSEVRRSSSDPGFVSDRPPAPALFPLLLLLPSFGHNSEVVPKPVAAVLVGLGVVVVGPASCSGRPPLPPLPPPSSKVITAIVVRRGGVAGEKGCASTDMK